jgi:hypothetical protein
LGISPTGQEVDVKSDFGSTPDGWVFGEQWAIAIEVKAGGAELSKQQLDSYQQHLQRVAPNAQVLRCHRSWRLHIASILENLYSDQSLSDVGRFLTNELREYLEVQGLGTASFTRQDFLDWDKNISVLKSRIGTLGRILADKLGNHQSTLQHVHPDYIGVNLIHNDFEGKSNYEVPHWSLGLAPYERRLRLFVQCEKRELAERLAANSDKLESQLTEALLPIKHDPRFQLRVEDKWFVMRAGRNERAPLYQTYFSDSLGNCQEDKTVQDAVRNALSAIKTINASRQRILSVNCLERYKRRTLIGVLQLDFSLNWFELEDLGDGVEDELRAAASKMQQYYEVLRPYGKPQPKRERAKR